MKSINNKPKTIFCDLDGTLVKHSNPVEVQNPNLKLEVLPGTYERLREWDSKGYYIIITTGRKRSARESTKKQLSRAGILYDELIMGFGGGDRIIINDRKPNSDKDTVFAINIDRNKGIQDVEL
jgi:hydroxymethylpyrimidine pyrophosphatase-like HAD family hydrolase